MLNFGLSAPIDVQITGNNMQASYSIAQRLQREMQTVPGAVDVRIAQVLNYPTLSVEVDRAKALELGFTEHDVALQCADLAELRPGDLTESVARLAQRGQLQRRGANSAAHREFAAGARQHSFYRQSAAHRRAG